MGGTELDQQAVEVLPFRINPFTNSLLEEVRRVDVDALNTPGFDGLECHGDPPDTRLYPPKRDTFEFRDLGEVKLGCLSAYNDCEILAIIGIEGNALGYQ